MYYVNISYFRLPKYIKHIIATSPTACFCKKYEFPFSIFYKTRLYTFWAVDLPVMVCSSVRF